MDKDTISINIQKKLEKLSTFTATPGHGCTRLPFTKEARQAADFIKTLMAESGLKVNEDQAGNVIGVLEGEDTQAPALVVGSHYDTVINGGNFDGLAGIVAGIEIAHLLKENGVQLKRNFIVVGFCDEEGMRFGTGYFGSKAMLGQITLEDLHQYKDKDNVSVYKAIQEYGLVPEDVLKAKQDLSKIKAFIEVHIEQGPVLDQKKVEIGLVECIVGIQRFIVTVHGRADHAGTTPMDMRIDAVAAATKVISKIPDWAREKGDGTVVTTGFVKVLPGGMNIIAEEVQFSIDIRSRNNDNINDIVAKIRAELDKACKANGASWEMHNKLTIEPVDLSENMLSMLQKSCETHGYSWQRMPSGAGHDALAIGQSIDTVMVFVPSKDGRSHCPVEWTEYADIAKAVTIIYDLIVDMQ
ncbi:allantoate deiminase [Desulfitobacterium sp. LBE]|uniref:M20 family metallo-hydrolase n=1 Tax=Desulfitobacterium sp. LBE TaxID=884086 RepID=UPI00119B3CC4|nr:M20 family metallo-hydrolase [Desulfitobacterium sp. LBE]TWH58118.1 allantoate deiminase [Desulfitobacterium sp. LBE]